MFKLIMHFFPQEVNIYIVIWVLYSLGLDK